jgi:hypothetical protein
MGNQCDTEDPGGSLKLKIFYEIKLNVGFLVAKFK